MSPVHRAGCVIVGIALSTGCSTKETVTESPQGSSPAPPSPTAAPSATSLAAPPDPWSPIGIVPIRLPPPAEAPPSLEVAATWGDLTSGNLATSFDVTATTNLYVNARLGRTHEGEQAGLNFLSPAGGRLAGYVAPVVGGEAHFDVKIAGTYVGQNEQTGDFVLIVGSIATQGELARATIHFARPGVP